MKRILWITPDRFDEKLDKSSWLEMAKGLSDLGWSVEILAGRRRKDASHYDGRLRYFDAIDAPFVFRGTLLIAMARWLKRNATPEDVVILNQDSLWLAPLLSRLGVHCHLDFRTLPVDVHGIKGWLNWILFWRLPVRWFGRSVDGYSFITERLRQEVEREFDLEAREYAIWHSAVDLARFASRSNGEAHVPKPFRLFYHGAITRKRGLGTVIEAIALGHAPENFEFRVVGDGPDREDLQREAERRGVGHCVSFPGPVPYEDVPAEVAQASVCICPLPDRLEWNVSSPLKVFEYLASGKPMILTPIEAHADLLADERFVVWTDGFSVADMRQAIDTAVEHRIRLTAAAHAASHKRNDYGWCVQAARLNRHLMRQVSRARGGDLTMRRQATAETRP